MALDDKLRERFERMVASNRSKDGSPGGGGGEPPHTSDTDARVAKLEEAFQAIGVTLARLDERMIDLATKADLAEVSGRLSDKLTGLAGTLETKAAATDLAEVTGRVGRLPSTATVAGMLAIMVAALAISTRLHVFG